MEKHLRTLITIADQESSELHDPLLFLGGWCLPYDELKQFKNSDYLISRPYNPSKNEKDSIVSKLREDESVLLSALASLLNEVHRINFSDRCWEIIIGRWLRGYLEVIKNRFETINQTFSENQIAKVVVMEDSNYCLAGLNTLTAIHKYDESEWNGLVFSKIIRKYFAQNLIFIDLKTVKLSSQVIAKQLILGVSFMSSLKLSVRRLANVLRRDSGIFIINSYLPPKREALLEIMLCQVPQLNITSNQKLITNSVNSKLRDELKFRLTSIVDSQVAGHFLEFLFDLLPICYLEGFSSLRENVAELNWPKNPSVIFTSNNFDTDEQFKLWTALCVTKGTKYAVGQHGNNYGTARYLNTTIEEKTSDRFLTWGWERENQKCYPAFIFKTVGRRRLKTDREGGLLLVELAHRGMNQLWDKYDEFENYFADQVRMIGDLEAQITEQLTIRLYQPTNFPAGHEMKRWEEFGYLDKIDADSNFLRLVARNRIIVFSYDSTGLLELLSLNLPCLAFWQNGLEHLTDEAAQDYQELIKAGIVHLSPTSLSGQLNEIWDDIDSWWMETERQEIRKAFCLKYARNSQRPLRDLKQLLSKWD